MRIFLLTKNNYKHPTYYNRLQAQCKYRLVTTAPFLSQKRKNKKTPLIGVPLEYRQTVNFVFMHSLSAGTSPTIFGGACRKY